MIASNIIEVVASMDDFRRSVPLIVARATRPETYPSAANVAEAAMRSVARTAVEIQAIPGIMATFRVATPTEGILEFTLKGLPFAALSIPTFWSAVEYKDVVEWVEKGLRGEAGGKDITAVDLDDDGIAEQSEVIANRVIGSIKNDPMPWIRTDLPDHGALNPTGLAAAVGLVGISQEALGRMLGAALDALTAEANARINDLIREIAL